MVEGGRVEQVEVKADWVNQCGILILFQLEVKMMVIIVRMLMMMMKQTMTIVKMVNLARISFEDFILYNFTLFLLDQPEKKMQNDEDPKVQSQLSCSLV